MMHKAWCNIEEVPYNFSGSSIKFWGHTGWKIDVSNPILVRLLGRSQLSNPSDLPCLQSHPDLSGTNELSLSFRQWLQLPSWVPIMALNGQWLPHAGLDGSLWIMECLHKIWISHRWQLCQWSQQNHLPSWAMAEMMAIEIGHLSVHFWITF